MARRPVALAALAAAAAALACALVVSPVGAFVPAPLNSRYGLPSSLDAKKKKGGGGGGKGFGKAPVAPPAPTPAADDAAAAPGAGTASYDDASSGAFGGAGASGGLTSIEGASDAVPTLDPDLPAEERAKQILRGQYGLRTAAETAEDLEQAKRDAEKSKAFKKQQRRLEQYRNMKDEDFDIFQVIPAPILLFIDGFLKVGTAVVTLLFVLAGVGITVEAWAAATGNKLPEDVDNFIVNVVEPNFTPGLFVLLGFSVSLGLFASAQLGSGTSQYKEDP